MLDKKLFSGNTLEGTLPRYEWTLPHFHFDDEPRECIFRIRYNISTNDYPDQFQKSTFETYENTQKIKNNPTVEVRVRKFFDLIFFQKFVIKFFYS